MEVGLEAGNVPESGGGAGVGAREPGAWEERVVRGSPGLAEGPAQGSAPPAERSLAHVSQGNA